MSFRVGNNILGRHLGAYQVIAFEVLAMSYEEWVILGSVILLGEGILFWAINEMPAKHWLSNRVRRMRKIFRNKHRVSILVVLWTSGVAIGMAAYTPPIPKEFFDLSYALLAAAIIWSAGMFLGSSFLINKKAEARGRWTYKAWKVSVPIVIIVFGIYCFAKVHKIEVGRDLSELELASLPVSSVDCVPPTIRPTRP